MDFTDKLEDYYRLATEDTRSASLHSLLTNNQERYTIYSEVATGGMKKIFRVSDSVSGRDIAMAVCKQNESSVDHEKFISEARLTALLQHPNIMPVYDIGLNEKSEPYFTMKFFEGGNLSELIRKSTQSSRLSLDVLLDYFLKVCDAVSYAHDKGVVHLDIKPENVLIGNFGEVLVTDWGLARFVWQNDSKSVLLDDQVLAKTYREDHTNDGYVKGTPGYMAPEQINRKVGDISEVSDVFSLGALLYYILSGGQAPFKGEKVLEDTLLGDYRPLNEFSSSQTIVSALQAVCEKCLSSKQEERYRSVLELKKEIEAYRSGFATSAEDAGTLTLVNLFFKRNKRTCLIAAISFIMIGLTLVSSFRRIQQQKQKALLAESKTRKALLTLEEQQVSKNKLHKEAALKYVQLGKAEVSWLWKEGLAQKQFRKALEHDGNLNTAWYELANSLVVVQNYNAALDALRKSNMTSQKYIDLVSSTDGKTFGSANELITFSEKFDAIEMKSWRQLRMRYLNFSLRQSVKDIEEMKALLAHAMKVNNPRFDSRENFQFYEDEKGVHLSFRNNKTLDEFRVLFKVHVDHLDISGSSIRDFDFLTAGKYETIDLSHTPFSLLWIFDTLKKIKKINLSHTSIKEVSHLQYSPVEELNLSYCKMLISLEGLSQAKNLKKLLISKDMVSLLPNNPNYEVIILP
ncbi:MAG: serine/threonine protein kinase [Lentisphaeraceae bacterium]|nr:serine/threonine protein kinase [Lentisphaeraceae bacterium]